MIYPFFIWLTSLLPSAFYWWTFAVVAYVSVPCLCTDMMNQSTVRRKTFFFLLQKFFLISFFFQRMFSIRTQRDSYWNCSFSWTNFEGRHALVTPATVSCERTSDYIINPEKTTGKAKEKGRRTALAIAFQLPRFGKALASINSYLIV